MLATHCPAPTLCTPKGECTPLSPSHCRGSGSLRPARRLPLCRPLSPRQVRRTRSARRPTPLSVRTVCGCSLACALTSWGLQARPSRGRLKKDRPNRRTVMLRYADPTECAQCALSFFCRPGSRADSAPARLSRCALGRGAPQSEALHRLRCAALAGAAPAAQRSLGHITGRAALLSGAGPGAARPSRRSLYTTTSTNACVSCVYERASEEISQTAPSLLCAQQSTVLLPPSAASAAASGPTVGVHAPRPRCAPRTHTHARARTHANTHSHALPRTHGQRQSPMGCVRRSR